MPKPSKKRMPKCAPCKPCWELKYCPYGPLVEFSPLHPRPEDIEGIQKGQQELLNVLRDGLENPERDWPYLVEKLMYFRPKNWEYILQFNVDDMACRTFGHICPVFFNHSTATETREGRRTGRHIPKDVMLKVVRRDNYHCQNCGRFLQDHELEFDHIIPVSRGGPTTVDNLRLLCLACNRKKSSAVDELLESW